MKSAKQKPQARCSIVLCKNHGIQECARYLYITRCVQAMPSLPPLAATRSLSNGLVAQLSAADLSLGQDPRPNGLTPASTTSPSSAMSAGAGTTSPDILPLLQSISSRLQRTDDRMARIEAALESGNIPSRTSVSETPANTSASAAESAAFKQGRQGGALASGSGHNAPEAETVQSPASGASGGMISPFANGPSVQRPAALRLPDSERNGQALVSGDSVHCIMV